MSQNAASLANLPTELYSSILDFVPTSELQCVTLSLCRALPHAPIPEQPMFYHVRLTSGIRLSQFASRTRERKDLAALVRTFSLEAWSVDAIVVINLIRQLPNVTRLSLYIGPDFAPEHLEELFAKQIRGLKFISLRFRPYVKKANYHQFLKGAYFDSTLDAFARWDESELPSVSIIQDPLDPQFARGNNFAQPLVFFRLDSFKGLHSSRLFKHVRNYRLRIPARGVGPTMHRHPGALPSIDLLDLSTCHITPLDLEELLGCFTGLRHLLLDNCPFTSGEPLDGQWRALGRSCAMAGVKKAKEREKKLKAWLEAERAAALQLQAALLAEDNNAPGPVTPNTPRARRGRRGLATATISIRDRPSTAPTPRVTVPRGEGHPSVPPIPKVRILPSLPALRNLTLTTASTVTPTRHAQLRFEFESGWQEGLLVVSDYRQRLRTSWANKLARIMRISDAVNCQGEMGYEGLVDVGNNGIFVASEAIDEGRCPSLCLAGPGERDGFAHVDDCAHQVASEVWEDTL